MAPLRLGTTLTTEERLEKQRLILRDSIALLSLIAIVVVLFVLTLLLFNSFKQHRRDLAARWQRRGEAAMQGKRPVQAIDALRSALAYAPGDQKLQVELAEALGSAGHTLEAIAYFNTLRETEPGSGMINLQLARLYARQGSEAAAIQDYQAAIDGKWEGDGYVRRRETRLELAKYFISRKHFNQARTQLLVAAGNAPDDVSIKLEIAGLLETAEDPADALDLYKGALRHRRLKPQQRQIALEGGGRTAYELGHFLAAKGYLEHALNEPEFDKQPKALREQARSMLAESVHILLLYPSADLSPRARAERIARVQKIAAQRLTGCLNPKNASLLTDLTTRWQHLPPKLTISQLARDPQLEQTTMQLVYDTEKVTSQVCGAPTGDDALLLKIAQAPAAVEQE